MSLKVYQGVRFRARRLQELVPDIDAAFKSLDELALAHEAAFIAKTATKAHDRLWHQARTDGQPLPAFRELANEAWREMRKRQSEVRSTGSRDPIVDSMIELQVWLGPSNRLYGYVHSEVRGVKDALLESGVADDYAYWNNSDRDPNVSASTWSRRAKTWRWLLSDEAPRSFQFVSKDYLPPPPALITAAVPPVQERARSIAENELYALWLQSQPTLPTPPPGDVSEYVARYYQFQDALQDLSTPWPHQMRDRMAELVQQLPLLQLP